MKHPQRSFGTVSGGRRESCAHNPAGMPAPRAVRSTAPVRIEISAARGAAGRLGGADSAIGAAAWRCCQRLITNNCSRSLLRAAARLAPEQEMVGALGHLCPAPSVGAEGGADTGRVGAP